MSSADDSIDSKLKELVAKLNSIEESTNRQKCEYEARITALEARCSASEARCVALETVLSRLKQTHHSMNNTVNQVLQPISMKRGRTKAVRLEPKPTIERCIQVEPGVGVDPESTIEKLCKEHVNRANVLSNPHMQSNEGNIESMCDVGESVKLANNKNARTVDDDDKCPVPRTIDVTVPKGYAVFLPEGFRVCTEYSSVRVITSSYKQDLQVVVCPLHDNLASKSFAMVHVVLFNVSNKSGNGKTVAIGAYVSAENAKRAMEEELQRWSSHVGTRIVCDGETVATIEIRQGIL